MKKRRPKRFKRRLQLRFWSFEDRTPRSGFTQNLSLTGMFICTNSPMAPGTRVVIEFTYEKEKVQLLGMVRHAERVDPVLRQLRPSGMGVRLIRVEEVMADLLDLEITAGDEPEEVIEAPAAAEPAAAPVSESAPPQPVQASRSEAPVFPVSFASRRELVVSFERDIRHGGLFVATPEPAEADDKVTLQFRFAWDPDKPLELSARVVKKFMAAEGSAAGEKVTGMGVAFAHPAEAIETLRKLVASLDQPAG